MIKLEDWVESGMYIFALVKEEYFISSDFFMTNWPEAVSYGEHRLVNVNIEIARGLVDYLTEREAVFSFGISDSECMLLTWEEAKEFASQYDTD